MCGALGYLTPMSDYPAYSRAERIADGTVHGLGCLLALVGTAFLIVWTMDSRGIVQVGAYTYAAALFATFAASACYHMTPWETLRPTLRRIDHAAIYLKIAGTYTPLVIFIGHWLAYVVLGIVWAVALFGMVMKLAFWRTPGRLGPLLYLALGWLSVTLLWPLAVSMPPLALWLVVAGGLTYSGGVVFYAAEQMKFSNAIWHLFVLAASACFFVAITMIVTPMT